VCYSVFKGYLLIKGGFDMALITCPECNKEKSEFAKVCPHCGFPTGEEISEDKVAIAWSNLEKKKFRKRLVALILTLLFLVASAVGIEYLYDQKAQETYNTYLTDLEATKGIMLLSGAAAETLCGTVDKVWYNAIHEESSYSTDKFTHENGKFVDFNTALSKLYKDKDIISSVSSIKDSQGKVEQLMKELQVIPENMERCYETVMNLYEAYINLTEAAINPTGSYLTYSESKNEYLKSFMNEYRKLDIQLTVKN
jgi:hypothetical protein